MITLQTGCPVLRTKGRVLQGKRIMSAEQAEGIVSAEVPTPQQPVSVAEELAATDGNTIDAQAALREDQIQNAVSFLSHPKVRGSTKDSKSSFLERKGLNPQEIEEAFRRAPEASTSAEPPTTATATVQQAALPPRKPFQTGTQATVSALQPVQYGQQLSPQPQSVRWTQVVIGASILVAGAYAVKQLVGPYAVGLYRKLYGIEQSSDEENKRSEEKKAADLVAVAIQSQTTELRATVDSLKEMVKHLEKGKQVAMPATDSGLSVSDLRDELHAFAMTLSEVTGKPSPQNSSSPDIAAELREVKALLSELQQKSQQQPQGWPRSAPQPAVKPYPSYSSGPIANGGHSVAPPAARFPHKAAEAPGQDAAPTTQESSPAASSQGADPPHPASYMEVLEMLERNETPPGIRTDIDDQPPNPLQPPPSTRMQPKAKPWERAQARPTTGGSTPVEASPQPAVTSGVTITELDDSPSPTPIPPQAGSWRPPPVPQPSLKLPSASAASSSSATEEVDD